MKGHFVGLNGIPEGKVRKSGDRTQAKSGVTKLPKAPINLTAFSV